MTKKEQEEAAKKKAEEDAAAKKKADEEAAAKKAEEEEKAKAKENADKTFTQADVDRELAKKEKEWKKKADDAEAKSKLAEDERTKLELKEANEKLAERDRRDAAIEEAGKAGVKNPRLFYNAYKDELEFDDKGKSSNITQVLESAKSESPELFGVAAGGSADGGDGKGHQATFTLDQVRNMSPDEYLKNEAEIDKFLATQK